jgi:hypothetical protein
VCLFKFLPPTPDKGEEKPVLSTLLGHVKKTLNKLVIKGVIACCNNIAANCSHHKTSLISPLISVVPTTLFSRC